MLDELRTRFRTRFIETARGRIRRSLRLLGDPTGAGSLISEMHSLAGEASMLGLDEIAAVARTGEEAAKSWHTGSATAQVACARTVRRIKQAIEAFAAAPDVPTTEDRTVPVPIEIVDGPAEITSKTLTTPWSPLRVLVVDDSELAAEQLVETLGDAGITARMATTREAAVEAAKTFAPALVLSDVHMPGVDITELCQTLRQAAATPLRIVLISGMNDSELAAYARAAGADGFASKQGGTEIILDRLRRLIEGTSEQS